MKRLSTFLVFIFLISILPINYIHHHENRIFQVNYLTIDTVDDNLDFSTCDIYQVLLTKLFISTIKISNNLFMPRISTCKFFFKRAPPE